MAAAPRIQVLPQNLINQIAAGEVVASMASVVKELVENSLDAGATRIEVSLENGLRDLVISDDGIGMGRDDAELSLQRHATSKIRSTEDLFNIATRGFRGEAVPSIASVSRLELQTRPREALAGTRIVVDGGRIERIEAVGCPPGTRFAVRDLFHNTPARLKFLKSPVAEMNAILRATVRQALASPRVGFVVRRDGDVVLELNAGESLEERFRSLMGSRVEEGLLAASHERAAGDGHLIRVEGLVARPGSSQADRRGEFLFVNGRPFTSKSIQAAIEQAARGFVMVGRFPIFCLFIEVAPGDVDVNVHPAKEEVRFRDERAVAGACHRAVREALEAAGVVPEARLGDAGSSGEEPAGGDAPPAAPPSPASVPAQPAGDFQPGFFSSPMGLINRAFEKKRARELQVDWTLEALRAERQPVAAGELAPAALSPSPAARADARVLHDAAARGADEARPAPAFPFAAPGERPDEGFWAQPHDPEPLGQVDLTYIIARFGPDLLIIDQHAAHERLRFLELKARPRSPERQALLAPIPVDIPAERRGALSALLPALREAGFDIEPMGQRSYNITAVPADLPGLDARRMILDLLDDMQDEPGARPLEELRERVLIRAACHSSIRAGARLSSAEMRALLDQMRRTRLSFTCPHGRPTIVRLGRDELDKQFKRVV